MVTRLHISAPWTAPLSQPAWRELWRMFGDGIPLPIALDVPTGSRVISVSQQEHEQLAVHHQLVTHGYATWRGGTIQLTDPARAMLAVLARPSSEVDVRMEIRGMPVRVLAAAPRWGDVVRVVMRDSVVSMEKVNTSAAALAAVDTLPASPGTGRIQALTIPAAGLERAMAHYRGSPSIDVLTRNIGSAAGQVHELLRHEPTLRAKFGAAARNRAGRRTRATSTLVVHDSPAGRHVVSRQRNHVTINRADSAQLVVTLTRHLNAAAGHA